MSARSGEWQLLGQGSDPVPHDTDVVERLADTYQQTGVAIRESADRLRRLAELDGWTGEAAEAFAEAAQDLHGDLSDAEQRYVDAGAALRRFVGPVTEARAESWGALQDAERAEDARRANSGDSLDGVSAPTQQQQDAQQRRGARLSEAEGELSAARTRLADALTSLQVAAGKAADDIRDAAEHSKDGRWDNIKGGLRDFADAVHLKTVVQVVGWVALAVAAVALVVALVATAPFWLVAVAAGLGAVLLAGDLILWANGSGDAEWYNVALDVAGLVTLGFARPFTAGATAATGTARGAAATTRGATAQADEIARLAATPNGIRAANASGMVPGNNLRIWSDTTTAAHATRAADAGTDAADAVRAGVAVRPGPLQSARWLDSDLAQNAAEIRRLRALGISSPVVDDSLRLAEQQLRLGTGTAWVGFAGNAAGGADLVHDVVVAEGPPPVIELPRDTLNWRLSDYEPEPAG